MIIFSTKLSRRRLVATFLALAAILGGAAVLGGVFSRSQTVSAPVSPKGIRTVSDQLEFLNAYGWKVSEEPLAVEDLLIPAEMGEEYDDYLALQTQQGFDLAKYAGKYVKRYTYEIQNYPTGEEGVQVSLLIYRHRVIAADVLSPSLNGFIHGLTPPESQTAATQNDAA